MVELTVQRVSYYVQTSLLGTDEHGRTLVVCPSPGCGDTAYVDADGRIVCPTGEAISSFLAEAYDQLVEAAEAVLPANSPLRGRNG